MPIVPTDSLKSHASPVVSDNTRQPPDGLVMPIDDVNVSGGGMVDGMVVDADSSDDESSDGSDGEYEDTADGRMGDDMDVNVSDIPVIGSDSLSGDDGCKGAPILTDGGGMNQTVTSNSIATQKILC
ncbi:hypothetical protein L2E82_32127 [Cichorium intybus]|uniref:Uncharacterized protein n=3 Tax=Cichorium intybus TaxID=13427 RepID=A0ACB9BGD1_CICIN|nr:hypothetical protein L2E82_32124 [Cichorium intybus]KAI3721121.1 hypothetical protein L2E82_32125 [Cichorium intybus]KAI3721123.1 hypothetical protein L2E82_32127 [Cichorium intybus]